MLATRSLADFILAAEALPPTVALVGNGKNFAGGSGTLTVLVVPVPILGFIDEGGEDQTN